MRLLKAVILPSMAAAQVSIVGNPTGSVLGIFAMCGTNPVDCANGWCCLNGQICTTGPKGANTACIDPNFNSEQGSVLSRNTTADRIITDVQSSKGVTVNAAYFGKMFQSQVVTENGTIPGRTTIQQQTVSGSSQVLPSTYFAMLSALVGAAALLI